MEQKSSRWRRLIRAAVPITVLMLMLGAVWVWQAQAPDPEKLYTSAVADAARPNF